MTTDNTRDKIMQSLLQLAEETEKQALAAVETANKANILAQKLIEIMQADSTFYKQTPSAGTTVEEEDEAPWLPYYTQPFVTPPHLYKPSGQPEQQPFTAPPLTSAGYGTTNNTGLPRNQIAAIPVTSIQSTQTAKPLPALSGLGTLEQSALAMKETRAANQQKKSESRLWQYSKLPVIALAIVVCLRLFVFTVVQVSGESMIPTLHNTDRVIVSKIAFKLSTPQRYDIIMLDRPGDTSHLIKRIIGLPGEHIEIDKGLVRINGVELSEEEYLGLDNTYTDGYINTIIPDGYYFVMGDNRPASSDSRSDRISNIEMSHINGKAILLFYPLNSFKIL